MGIHKAQRGRIGVTAKTIDGFCYTYTIMARSGRPIQLNRFGEIPFRCRNTACKAKLCMRPAEYEKLKDLNTNFDHVSRNEFWTMGEHRDAIHTCSESNQVEPWYSDTQILRDIYRELKLTTHDHGGSDMAWTMACVRMETGAGMELDAAITKTRQQHTNAIKYDRKRKKTPANYQVRNASELRVDEEMQYLTYTNSVNGQCSGQDQKWYQGLDSGGNHYFLSRTDCEILKDATEVHVDSTFDPVKGMKDKFRQLLCICVRRAKPDGSVVTHIAA